MLADPLDSRLHPLHRLWRMLPARQRRALLWRATSMLAPRPTQPPPPAREGMAVAGELSRASGLGEVARLMVKGLERLGVPCWQLDVGAAVGAASDLPPVRDQNPPPPGAPLLMHVNAPILPFALLRLPRALSRGRRIVGYWAWELPSVPADWRAGVPFVHEAWVLSRFTGTAIEPLLPGRVRVVPPPLAIAPPVPSGLDRAAFGLPTHAVVVLVSFNLASSFERKNPLGAIAAFRAAFRERPDRILVLKTSNPGDFSHDFGLLRETVGDAPNIRLETRTLPPGDSHALTAAADVVFSLHRSEGFGLIPAEAMLLGRPVVATGWSGNMDFMDADSARLVGYRLVPARDPRGVFEAPGAVWAEPDLGEAVAALRRLADDPGARAALGARGREAAEARLGLGPLAEALDAIGLGPQR
jgi:glycosyltransferase involved in cell wall biosynthesis